MFIENARTVQHRRTIALWLFACAALVFAMVVLGGVTRLTRSGLSIVEWDPIMGAIPPLSQTQWETLFEKYKLTPEYQKVNVGMDLEGFKGIFWLEYLHRLLGRLIGFVFLVPFLYFLARGRIERSLVPKLATMFVLGALQGLLGWLMVASGLVDVPRVSAYRLTAHLLLATAIYGYMVWTALGLLAADRERAAPGARGGPAGTLLAAIVLMIASGGFVAGIRAGYAFNTWPLMHGRLFPEGIWALAPGWTNLFENIQTVQFVHRWLAMVVLALAVLVWARLRAVASQPAGAWAHLLPLAALAQVALGIATLVNVVPVPLGAAHQAGALVLFTVALAVLHRLGRCR
jgi:cytochrome c oxidase assembly protein subunit 15